MAKQYRTEYGIGIRDDTTSTIKKVQDNIRNLNNELKNVAIGSQGFETLKNEIIQAEGVLKQAKDGIGAYGKEQNKLRDFIREEKLEQRQQNFLFQQGKDVVGAASVALSLFSQTAGDSNKTMKTFSDSLNKGFITFQGLDFLLKAVPGPWGLAISAVGGLTAAVVSFINEVNDAEPVKKFIQDVEKFTKYYDEWSGKLKGNVDQNKEVSEAEAELLRQKVNVFAKIVDIEHERINLNAFGINNTKATLDERKVLAGLETEIVGKSTKEIIDLFNSYVVKLQAVEAATRTTVTKINKEIMPVVSGMNDKFLKGFDQSAPGIAKMAKTIDKELRTSVKGVKDEWNEVNKMIIESQASVQDSLKATNDYGVAMESAIGRVGGAIDQNIRKEFEKAFGEANSLLEQFVQEALAQFARLQAEKAITGVLDWFTGGVFGFLGGIFHQGGTIPKAHSGMYVDAPPSKEFPILVRGGETVRTEAQERTVQQAIYNNQRSSTVTINIGPGNDELSVLRGVEKALRRTGITVDKLLVNNRSKLVIA